MATELGRQEKDRPNSRTLRQAIKEGFPIGKSVWVKIIFKPGKLPYWTLIVKDNWKVVVPTDTALFAVLEGCIEEWIKGEYGLAVQPDEDLKGGWSLHLDEENLHEWEAFDWGYKITYLSSRTSKGKKTHPKKTAEIPAHTPTDA